MTRYPHIAAVLLSTEVTEFKLEHFRSVFEEPYEVALWYLPGAISYIRLNVEEASELATLLLCWLDNNSGKLARDGFLQIACQELVTHFDAMTSACHIRVICQEHEPYSEIPELAVQNAFDRDDFLDTAYATHLESESVPIFSMLLDRFALLDGRICKSVHFLDFAWKAVESVGMKRAFWSDRRVCITCRNARNMQEHLSIARPLLRSGQCPTSYCDQIEKFVASL